MSESMMLLLFGTALLGLSWLGRKVLTIKPKGIKSDIPMEKASI